MKVGVIAGIPGSGSTTVLKFGLCACQLWRCNA